jgi:predicted transposase/invertase (TIGR01784 family)
LSAIILPRSDLLFQAIFGDEGRLHILKAFLKAVLDLSDEDLAKVTLRKTNLTVENALDKQSVLDVVVVTGSGRRINIEIQLEVSRGLPGRVAYYNAKLMSQQLAPAGKYVGLNQCITILIVGEPLFAGEPGYHHRFWLAEPDTGIVFTKLVQIDTLELTKVPPTADGSDLWKWLAFIGAKDEEEIEMTAQLDPVIGQAATLVKHFSDDEEFRIRQLLHEKWLHERADGIYEAELRGRDEGRAEERERLIRSLLAKGIPTEEIASMLDVDAEDVARLMAS